MQTSFQEFLRQKVEGSDWRDRKRLRSEWLDALNRLLDQIRDWLRESDPEGVLELVPYKVERVEERLGVYGAPALQIRLNRADVDRETASIQHPAVLRALEDLKEAIENGSFGRVTESYRTMDVDLTEQVNQVRKFRNWVAHGRRGRHANSVDPEAAMDRLRSYLARLEEVEKAATRGSPPIAPKPDAAPEPE